ncbi:hypothetical protein Bpfe_018671, partial [Biomphalaria pfeifferi]
MSESCSGGSCLLRKSGNEYNYLNKTHTHLESIQGRRMITLVALGLQVTATSWLPVQGSQRHRQTRFPLRPDELNQFGCFSLISALGYQPTLVLKEHE